MIRHRHPRVLAAGAAVAVAAALGAGAAPAEAAPALRIVTILYNPPGPDRPTTNRQLNAEYVVVKNVSRTTRVITGWTLRDRNGHVYTFPTTRVGAGKTVRLRTGRGDDVPGIRYWGYRNYVWNNSGGDTATLRTASGALVHTCTYTANASGVRRC